MAGGGKKPHGVRTFTGSNWEDYKVELRRYSRTQRSAVWEIITGDRERPAELPAQASQEEQDTRNKAIQEWDEADAEALQIISCTLHENKRATIRHCNTAAKAWAKLESAAAARSGSSVIAGIYSLVRVQQSDHKNMDDYLTEIVNQSQLLRNQQVEIPDIVLAALMIHGVSEEFATQKALLEDKPRDVLTSDFVRTKLLEAEKNLECSTTTEGAFKTALSKRNAPPPFRAPPGRPQRKVARTPLSKCDYCGKPGLHTAEKCYKRRTDEWKKEFPDKPVPNWRVLDAKRPRTEQPNSSGPAKRPRANLAVTFDATTFDPPSEDDEEDNEVASVAHDSGDTPSSEADPVAVETPPAGYVFTATRPMAAGSFILDSGATSAMSDNRAHFTSYQPFPKPKRLLGAFKGQEHHALGKGTLCLDVQHGNRVNTLRVPDSLYVTNLCTPLLSVSKLDNAGMIVIFHNGAASIHDADGNDICVAKRRGNLYQLPVLETEVALTATMRNPIEEWHLRLGHLSEKTLQQLAAADAVKGMPNTLSGILPKCEACLQGKQRKANPSVRTRTTTAKLDTVHSDLVGPIRKQSRGV
jgi:hypothetical protein